MGLETVAEVADLNELWPLSTDPRTDGDDHIRAIKVALKSLLTDMSQVDSRHVDMETPGGIAVNATHLTLAHAPVPEESLLLFRNGVLCRFGTGSYVLTGTDILVPIVTSSSEWFQAWYRY